MRELLAIAAAGAAVCVAVAVALATGASEQTALLAEVATAAAIALVYLIWKVDPAYTLSAALVLTACSGNWGEMGIPGALSPDRLLLALAAVSAVTRAPAADRRRILRIKPVHWVLALSVLYVAGSAASVGTLDQQSSLFRLVQAFGVLPFLIFLVAPLAFRTERQRRILLGALVALGAYLGITAILEVTGLRQFLFPRYIANPHVGIHFGHARGPFVQAAVNGFALYLCATASIIAALTWRGAGARAAAQAVAGLCLLGCLLTLQRSVWVGVVLGSLAALLIARDVRRVLAPVLAVAAGAAAVIVLTVPSVSSDFSSVLDDSENVQARQITGGAAIDMVSTKPLVGFGWDRYQAVSPRFLEQPDDSPLSGGELNQLHNLFLSYAADLGLIGLGLWALGLGLGVAGAMATRPAGDLRLWRLGLVPVVIFFLAVASFTPSSAAFPILALWLWIGVVWTTHYFPQSAARRSAAAVVPAA
jgi:O-antigen ligase